jgi:sterol desaturase/sphingolipid hydroxylase (fatty acid hydroxylase superfamily)
METSGATQIPFNEAAIYAFAFGLFLGELRVIVDLGTFFAQKKLQLKDDEVLKYLAVLAAVSVVILLVNVAALSLWAPSMAVRQKIFNGHLEALGYGFFTVFMMIGMVTVLLLERLALALLRKKW